MSSRLSNSISSVSLGTGIWILSGSQGGTPLVLVVTAVILVCVGGLILLLKGIRHFGDPEGAFSSFISPLSWGIGIATVLILAEHAIRYLAFPYPLDDGEGFVLNQAVRLASHLPLYPPLGGSPYVVTNYPPVHALLLSIFTDPTSPGFFMGRMISVLSTALIALAANGIVRKITGNRMAGVIAGILAIASPVVYFWGALLRVDMLASALTLAGLWIAISQKGWKMLWSVPLLVAALYTRQSSVEAALAIALALIFNAGEIGNTSAEVRKRGIVFTILWILGAGFVLAVTQMVTHGEFWRHTVEYTKTQFFPGRIWSAAEWILPSHAMMLLLAIFALPRTLANPKRKVLGYFFAASVATALLSGKVGSDLNYFINLAMASALLAGCLFADFAESVKAPEKRPQWIMAALLLFPAAIAQSGLIEGSRMLSFTPIQDDYYAGSKIVDILNAEPGPILSEDEGFCLLSHHEVVFNPFIMSELAREKIWDQTVFVDWIRSGGPRIIMLRFDVNDPNNDDRAGAGGNAGWDRWTVEMEKAISDTYEIDKTVSPIYMRRTWYIYRPKAGIK
jgi:hypothetical protein